MPTTFIKIASVTVGSGGAASMSFSSIPSTYTDLVLKISARGDYAALGSSYKLSFNGSNSSFSVRALEGAGSGTPSSFTQTQYVGSAVGSTATANTFNNGEIYIPNYTSTANVKSFSVDAVSENNGTEAYADLIAGLWSATPAAITSLALTPTSGNFTQYSTAVLYGIKNS
jgi:surface antigen